MAATVVSNTGNESNLDPRRDNAVISASPAVIKKTGNEMRLPEIQLVVTDEGGPSASKQENLVNMSSLDPLVVPEVESESKNLDEPNRPEKITTNIVNLS